MSPIPKKYKRFLIPKTIPMEFSKMPKDLSTWVWEPLYKGWLTTWLVLPKRDVFVFAKNYKIELTNWKSIQSYVQELSILPFDMKPAILFGQLINLSSPCIGTEKLQKSGLAKVIFFDIWSEASSHLPLKKRHKLLYHYVPSDCIVHQRKILTQDIYNLVSSIYISKLAQGIILKDLKSKLSTNLFKSQVTQSWLKLKWKELNL